MMAILGIAVTVGMVFGGYLIAGGKMAIIMKSLPFEMMMIGGAATGAFLVSNDMTTIKHTGADLKKMLKGPKWTRQDYLDLLCLLFELTRLARQSPLAIEAHVDAPAESDIFKKYPRIAGDRAAMALICDTLRSASMNFDDPHQVDEALEKDLEKQLEESLHSAHALQSMADALPALGIVAAVLGVIKTMSSIDQPPEILGKMIGGALVGTFLGVFLAYGIVGPFAARIKALNEEDHRFYALIRDVMVMYLRKHPPNVCIEVGRKSIPTHLHLDFAEVDEQMRSLKASAKAAA